MSKGVLYVGTSQKFFQQAIESAKTVSSTNDISCAIITSERLATTREAEIFDDVIPIKKPFDDVRDKIYNLNRTPYEKTLFLDGDTIVLGDISPIYMLLERVDIAAAYATGRFKVLTEDIPDCLPELNTAVLAYDLRSDDVHQMLSLWEELQKEQIETGRPRVGEQIAVPGAETLEQASRFGNLYGQTTFREALYRSDVSYSILPPEYNYGKTGRGYARYDVKILHGKRRANLQPIINKRLTSRQLVGDILYYPSHGSRKRIGGTPVIDPLLKQSRSKIVDSSKKIGVYNIIRQLKRKIMK